MYFYSQKTGEVGKHSPAISEGLDRLSFHRKTFILKGKWDAMVIWERKVWSSDKSEAMEVGKDNLHTKPIAYWLDATGLHMIQHSGKNRGRSWGGPISSLSLGCTRKFTLVTQI